MAEQDTTMSDALNDKAPDNLDMSDADMRAICERMYVIPTRTINFAANERLSGIEAFHASVHRWDCVHGDCR